MSKAHTCIINPKPATGNGDIAGFIAVCTDCGWTIGSSMPMLIDEYVREHQAYMLEKTARERIERMRRKGHIVGVDERAISILNQTLADTVEAIP